MQTRFLILNLFKIFVIIICQIFLKTNTLYCKTRSFQAGVFKADPLVIVSSNKPAGLFIDLIEYMAKEQGWQIKYVQDTWDNLLVLLEKGEIDLLPAVGYTGQRLSKYDFNRHAVYVDSGVLYTGKRFALNTVFDLRGKRVAAVRGSIFTSGFISYIDSFGVACQIIYTEDNTSVMHMVTEGQAEAGVCIYSLGNELMKKFPVDITAISFSPIALHFAVPKGRNNDLITGINRMMDQMMNNPDSAYKRIFNKWTKPPRAFIPPWIWWGIFILTVLGIAMILWNFFLNRQVSLKTAHLEEEIRERRAAEKKVQQSLTEKDTLIRELYHRTKNTMQVIQSLIALQSADFPDQESARQLVKTTGDRIQAIALVHAMLYQSRDLSRINIHDYILDLARHIFNSFEISRDQITLKVEAMDQLFLLDIAIPFGLILNELISNSLKYAFPNNQKGDISIKVNQTAPDACTLLYADNGVGVAEDFDFRRQSTLGMKLIFNIAENQLRGTVQFTKDHGIRCSVLFSNRLYNARV